MKQRTVSHRNLLGAFVGGMVGILTFGYFGNAVLMANACFLGVVGGWWYQEVARFTIDGFNSGLVQARQLNAFLFTPVRNLSKWRMSLSFEDLGPVIYFGAILMIPFIWLSRRPAAIAIWVRAHPGNRAYLARAATLPVLYALSTAVIGSLVLLLIKAKYGIDMNHSSEGLPFMFGAAFLFVMGISSLVTPLMMWESHSSRPLDQMRNFYRLCERYSSIGPLRFYVTELIESIRVWYSFMVWIVVGLTWLCGAGLVFLVIIASMSAVIGFARGVYTVSMRAGHWLCFGVTLTVTALAAWMGHNHFGDFRIIWMTALATGVVSALATEGIRRSIVWVFRVNRLLRAVALVPLGKQLRPGGSMFCRITSRLGDWFLSLLPLPMSAKFA